MLETLKPLIGTLCSGTSVTPENFENGYTFSSYNTDFFAVWTIEDRFCFSWSERHPSAAFCIDTQSATTASYIVIAAVGALRRASTAAVWRTVFGRGPPQLVPQRRRRPSPRLTQNFIRAVSTPAQRRRRRHLADNSTDIQPIGRLLRAEAVGPHRAQIGISTGDTHGVSRADSTPGHGDTPRAGHGGDGTPDAPTTPRKEQTFEEALGGGDKQPHSGKPAADTPATHADEATDTTKAGHGFSDANGSGKADADAKQGHDSVEHADADPKAKDHSANGEADDAADSARHDDKTEADKAEADKPTSDKSHEEDDAAHHDDAEHPKDTDDTHKSDQDEKYEDLYDHSHDKDGPDSSYNPETDPHSKPDPNYDSLPDSSINQSEGFPEGVDRYTTPPRTRRQLQEALEAWPEYMKKELPQDAKEWHTGRFGFDDMVNPERALGFNPVGSPRSMKDFMDTFFDKEKGQPV